MSEAPNRSPFLSLSVEHFKTFELHLMALRDELEALSRCGPDTNLKKSAWQRSRGVQLALDALYLVAEEEPPKKRAEPNVQLVSVVKDGPKPQWVIDLDAEKEKA